jgi:5'-nucleotidase/UDP-sugar diphosphatase
MRLVTFCILLALLAPTPAWAEQVRLLLLHTNDVHGHLETSSDSGDMGGFVRVANVIRTLKTTFPDRVVVLDGGDFAVGTPTSGLFHGLPTAEAMASLGYDAIAIGNHEFDWGQEAMLRMLKATNAPIVCANLVRVDDGGHPFAPFTVVERGGVKLGIIGLVAPDTATRTPEAHTRGWSFQQAAPAMRTAMGQLPEVDVVLALSHLGVDDDRALAQAVPEIDLIVGGHSHTPLEQPVVENGVPIVQAGCYSRFVGVLEVEVDTDLDSLRVVSYRLVPIDDSIGTDPQVAAVVEGYASQVRPILDRVVGEVTSEVRNQTAEGSLDRSLGNLVADMLRAEAGTDFAVYNRGGVRGDMPAGSLTVRLLHEMFPFDDNVVVLRVSGAALAEILQEGTNPQAALSLSGLRAHLDSEGHVQLERDGKPLDPEAMYTLATTNFLATGGDRMSTLTRWKAERTLPFTRDVVQAYVEKHPTVQPPETGRFTRS